MMKRMLCALLLVAALLLMTNCLRPANRRLMIFVVDLTGSIKEDAQTQALTAIQSVFAENLLQRGDALVVIPITDDSLTEAQGHIMRFRLGAQREAYDQDIRRLAQDVLRRLHEMQEAAITRPYKRSDILGAADLVAEELDAAKSVAVRKVVFLSDFIQDDVQYDFKGDAKFQSERSAEAFAHELAQRRAPSFHSTAVYMGLLRSSDLKKLSPEKRAAIRSFWAEYFRVRGATTVFYATDGSGGLLGFINEQ